MKRLVFALILLLTVVASAVQAATADLQGAWIAKSYQPHDSQISFDLRGQIQFGGDRWSLTYIVLNDGKPQRAFAQVGRFTGAGDKLDLYGDVALYPYAPAVPGLWEQRERYIVFPQEGAVNPVKAQFAIEGDRLTMIFGAGSKMTFLRAAAPDSVEHSGGISISHQPDIVYTSPQGVAVDPAKPSAGAWADNQHLTWMFNLVIHATGGPYRIEAATLDYSRAGQVLWKKELSRDYLEHEEWIRGAFELTTRYFLDNVEFSSAEMKSTERKTAPDIAKGGDISWVRIGEGQPFFADIDAIKITFHLTDASGLTSVVSHVVPIHQWKQKVKLHLPFDGEWIVASGNDLTQGHRRTGLNGVTTYAWDLMKVGEGGKTFRTDGKTAADYYTYQSPVLAVGDGTVVAVRNDIEEVPVNTMPSRERIEKDPDVFAGNFVVIDHGNGEYTQTAHMIAGSIPVKVGEVVKTGQVIGRAGSSGVAIFPHIHVSLMDGPRWLEAKSVPAQFSDFDKVLPKHMFQHVTLGNPQPDWLIVPSKVGQ